MPLLNSTNTSNQPRKAKSFSSLKRHPLRHAKSFNTSELAHREALTAAELAFERARERFATSNEPEQAETTNVASASLGSGDPQLNRKQSIRFTGSNAVKTRELPYTRREVSEDQEFGILRDRTSRRSYVESSIASEPSSYRKLRRAKSMFNPNQTPSEYSANVTNPSRGGPFKRDSMRSSDGNNSPTKPSDHLLRRSFSFLRGVTDKISTGGQNCTTESAAVQVARDQYLRQLRIERLKEQPSLENFAQRRQHSRGLRPTVRTSSNTSNVTIIQSPLLPSRDDLKVKSLSQKARSVSHSLKRTLKKVFSRPSPDAAKLPEQHLSATKAHYGENWDRHYAPASSPDVELLRRVDSRESFLPEFTHYREDDKIGPTDNLGSLNLEDNSSNLQSRITSWSNSTTGNTLNAAQFVERKRLSVIKEDGDPYQPSSSAMRYKDQQNGYSAFTQPARLDHADPAAAQRIYSALQREIQKADQVGAHQDVDESEADSDSGHSILRQSHITLGRALKAPTTFDYPTIFQSQSESSVEPTPLNANLNTNVNERSTPLNQSSSWHLASQNHYSEPIKRLTPQQIAHFNEPEVPFPKKPLREVKSAFFPSESRIERRAISPFRRAMHDSGEVPPNTQSREDSGAWPPRTAISVRKSSTARSESVYSRTEGGHSPRFVGSSISLPGTESSGEPGTALVIPSGKFSSRSNLPSHNPWRRTSDQSSGEWKSWMASEFSHFENHIDKNNDIYDAFPVKESGHKRENAECDGEETGVGNVRKSIHATKQPLGTVQMKTTIRPALQESITRSNTANSPSGDLKAFRKEASMQQKENTPNLPAEAPFDTHINVLDGNFDPNIHTATLLAPKSKASRIALHGYSENNSPLSSSNEPNSPQRVERLRRLANRSSQSLNMTVIPLKRSSFKDECEDQWKILHDSPRSFNSAEQSKPDSSSRGLVGDFLKRRRSHMRISDESGGDPAFL